MLYIHLQKVETIFNW